MSFVVTRQFSREAYSENTSENSESIRKVRFLGTKLYADLERLNANAHQELTPTQIAEKSGVSENTVRKSLRGESSQRKKAIAMVGAFGFSGKDAEKYLSPEPFKNPAAEKQPVFREWEAKCRVAAREIAREIPLVVFKSEHRLTKGRFARAKRFFLHSLSEEEIREAKTYALPRHAEVCLKLKGNERFPVFIDLGFGDDGTFWSLDEWEEGTTIREWAEQNEETEPTCTEINLPELHTAKLVPTVALEMLHALSDLHQNGVIMRRLTPDCVFLTKSGKVQLRDFEFAKITGVESKPFGWQRSVYLASEVDTTNIDPRTDIRSWAAVVLFMLLGRDPIGDPKDELKRLRLRLRLSVHKKVESCLLWSLGIQSDRPSIQDAVEIVEDWAGK